MNNNNRILLTEKGDKLRLELLQEKKQQEYLKYKSQQPKILMMADEQDHQQSSVMQLLKTEAEQAAFYENVLKKKSASDIALTRMMQKAQLSISGPRNKQKLKDEMLQDLVFPKLEVQTSKSNQKLTYKYLDQQMDSIVNKITSDKNNYKYRLKQHQVRQIQQLETTLRKSPKLESTLTDRDLMKVQDLQSNQQNQSNSIIEDFELSNKMKDIIHAEGKLERIFQRYQQHEVRNKIMHEVKILYENFFKKIKENLQNQLEQNSYKFEKIRPMSPTQMKKQSQQELEQMYQDDTYEERRTYRIKKIFKKKVESQWKNSYVPQTTKRWNKWVSEAQIQNHKYDI